ncbi:MULTISPECIES: 50S ribosomal protein L24 [Kineosporia]|uniref:Large ribosomal subunit protein uL24 n=1 Tax=Kineosporia mesophila TaxID=566012 RepID=A0ABP6ZTH4_9ACTN|nr:MULTISPECIES: 50S ribosomal protein L24 [Kineosporia]MCD5349989.1 50S ribosomal protein L24 [Kineosporia mesophila]GLY27701.1 50S ribosomal protein L24 [Kineosporia sp. NBRC 101731]
MAKMRIKKGDTVQLITGRSQKNGGDRNKTGKVISVNTETQRVLVEGLNRVKRHTKEGQSSRGSQTGGIITQEAAIHISNLMLVDPETKKATRVGTRVETVERDGKTKTVRVRYAKRSGKDL